MLKPNDKALTGEAFQMNIAEDLSIQLYSLRDYGDLESQLAALSKAGFRRVELIGSHLDDASGTRAKLDAYGMSAPTGHAPLGALRDRLDWVAEQANTIGMQELYMPALPDAERALPADAWRRVGAELGQMAEKLKPHGLALGYHNHDWELKPFADGTTALEHLFAGADGSPLTFEADLAWLVRGGADPAGWMRSQRTRLTAVHVKDIAAPGTNLDQDGWADIGAGTLDWPTLWREALALGAKWMVLEHDKPKDPIGFAKASRAYLLQQLA
jgi:sugar phosphate isomerase/epimerase